MVSKANAIGGLEIPLARWRGTFPDGPPPHAPATGMSWNGAARFVNWLNTSEGHPPAYKFAKQPGDAGYNPNQNILLWDPGDAGYDEDNLFRNSLAHYFLPSADEWYKAAYYDPAANDGVGAYWDFPTGADSPPTPVASGTTPGTCVYEQPRPAEVTQAGGLSPYGVMGLCGNAYEWEETDRDLVNDDASAIRGLRGGEWFNPAENLSSSSRLVNEGSPGRSSFAVGFRVTSIPPEGDYNLDGNLDVLDIDLQAAEMRKALADQDLATFDHNRDGIIDVGLAGADPSKLGDRLIWIGKLRGTWVGDVNLDGEFNSGDLVAVFGAGEYEDETVNNSGWEEGDWDGDGDFATGDLVLAFQDGGYELGPRVAANAVPEPTSLVMLTAALSGVLAVSRTRQRPI